MIVHSPYKKVHFNFHLRPSRWDRSPQSLASSLNSSRDDGATVICLTEVADGKRPDTLRAWCTKNTWGKLQDNDPWQKGETAILINYTEWFLVDWATVRIGPDLGPGLPVVATLALLKHRETDVTVLVSVSHLPSAVESIWSLKGSKRALAYRRCVINYRKAVTEWRKEFKPDLEAISADWNLDINKSWVRNYLEATWRQHDLVRLGTKEPTHGNRKIDAWLLKDAKGKTDVMEAHPSSDHRATELVIFRYLED